MNNLLPSLALLALCLPPVQAEKPHREALFLSPQKTPPIVVDNPAFYYIQQIAMSAPDSTPPAIPRDTLTPDSLLRLIGPQLPHWLALYRHYHENPELSLYEVETARRQAAELRAIGCEVHEGIGGTGVVGVIRNGPGPVIYWRGDMDALPIQEDNAHLPYRSRRPGVAHLCGHDMHSTLLVGLAYLMGQLRDHWQGTLVLVCQPAEEGMNGARHMLQDGLYERFGRPDAALAYHVAADLPAGQVGICPGRAMALSHFADLRVFGEPGHGGNPHLCIDAPVLTAMILLRIQALVAREIDPLEPAVVSVCAINGGDQYAALPAFIDLKLTIRCYSEAVHQRLLTGIERICRAEAEASGLPPELFPVFKPFENFTEPLYNDPVLAEFMAGQFRAVLGEERYRELRAVTTGEDFAHFSLGGEIPVLLARVGSVPPEFFDAQGQPLRRLEPLHSPNYYPQPEQTLESGLLAMTHGLIELFNAPASHLRHTPRAHRR